MARRNLPSKRNWGTIREWMNVAAAIGALLVGVVSLWTTAQISGLEDYFRSEIGRRNSDLNSLADQSRRLGALADEREKQLAQLQTTTGQVMASNLDAQGKLISTQQELSRLGFEVVGAREKISRSEARLASLAMQSDEQIGLIDLFRRQRLFETAYRRIVFGYIRADQASGPGEPPRWDGEAVYRLVTDWPAGAVEHDLAAYLPELRSNAGSTCNWLRGYEPKIVARQSYPDSPIMPGRPTGDGISVKMSKRDYEEWQAARAEWFKRFSEISDANDRAQEANQKARDYLNHAAASCVCQALATAKHPAGSICPGYEKAPKQPV